MSEDLHDFFEKAKAELIRANHDKKHPFRLCTLGTLGDFPAMRTVVKRTTTNDLETLIYTDRRSNKVEQILVNPHSSILFYHPKKKLQVSIRGIAKVIKEGDLFEKHRQIAMVHPGDYTTQLPPGSNIDLKDYQQGTTEYFALIKIEAVSIEILQLSREGHQRAFYKSGEEWSGSWLVP